MGELLGKRNCGKRDSYNGGNFETVQGKLHNILQCKKRKEVGARDAGGGGGGEGGENQEYNTREAGTPHPPLRCFLLAPLQKTL